MRTLALVLSLTLLRSAPAQLARYELGRRLIACDLAWQAAAPPARAAASPELGAATTAFFGLALGEAARRLDAARFVLVGAPGDPAARAAAALACVPEARVVDGATRSLHVHWATTYDPDVEVDGLRVAFGLARGDLLVGAERTVASAEAVDGCELPLPHLEEGAYSLRWRVLAGERVVGAAAVGLDVVRDLAARVQALTAAAAQGERDHDAATLRYLERRLQAAIRGQAPETDLPHLSFLRDAEAIVAARASGRSFVGAAPRGDRWLCLRLGRREVPVRIRAPLSDETPGKRPLLVLLHGAGGSENMFFDAYGAGTYVARASDRGWVVAAPGNVGPALPELVQALTGIYPIDPARVLVVGHSMGAAQAIAAGTAGTAPPFRAVAALGGGGRLTGADLRARAFFVGTGGEDFARSGALALRAALARAGASVRWQDYADTEHLGVVQRAAADVFAWLDGEARGK